MVDNNFSMFCHVEGTDQADIDAAKALLRHHYPGYGEYRATLWDELRTARRGRSCGISGETAASVIDQYNETMGRIMQGVSMPPAVQYALPPDDLSAWPTAPKYTENAVVGSKQEPPLADESIGDCSDNNDDKMCRQMVYGPFETLAMYDLTSPRYIGSPMLGVSAAVRAAGNQALKDAVWDANAKWSTLLNLAMHGVFMSRSTARYPLRFVLPEDWQTSLHRLRYKAGEKNAFAGVFLLRYDDSGYTGAFDRFHAVTDSGARFIPLLLFRSDTPSYSGMELSSTYARFKLFNYAGYLVEWGDFSPRKRITWYELRDVMSHLPEGGTSPRWSLLRIKGGDGTSGNVHLLVRRHLGEEDEAKVAAEEAKLGLEPVCLAWGLTSDGKGTMQLVDRISDNCSYQGHAADHDTDDTVKKSNLRYRTSFSRRPGPETLKASNDEHDECDEDGNECDEYDECDEVPQKYSGLQPDFSVIDPSMGRRRGGAATAPPSPLRKGAFAAALAALATALCLASAL